MPERNMADQVLTKQKLINADEDVQALEDVVNGEPGKLIKTRLGREVYTLASVPQINTMTREEVTAAVASRAPQGTTYTKTEVDSALSLKAPQSNTYTKGEVDASLTAIAGGHKAYGSLAAALANTSTLPMNSIVEITNDPDASKNGTYQWNGGDLTKSAYDPLTQAKTDATTKANAAEVNAKAYADQNKLDLSTIYYKYVGGGLIGEKTKTVNSFGLNGSLGWVAGANYSSKIIPVNGETLY